MHHVLCATLFIVIINVHLTSTQLNIRKIQHNDNTRRQQQRNRKSEPYDQYSHLTDTGEVSDQLKYYTHSFEQKVRETVRDEEYMLKNLWYDPEYVIHDLCEPHKSGGQTGELKWSESGDRLLKVIGNGVVEDGYNMFMAPGQSQGKRTDVHVAVYIESMSSFKAQSMDFEVDMYLAMGWFDRRLAHNCTHPILVTSKLIADRIWYPDLYFVNSKYAYLQEVTTPNLMVIVYPDGLIFKTMRLDVTLSCMMDLKLFPLDYQECPLTIQSFAYIEQIVNLTWRDDPPNFPIGFNPDIKLNDMQITNKRFVKCAGPYPMFRGEAAWSCIQGYIVMKRLVLFHIIQTYIPTGMLVSISWMSFWLDPRASPARISLTITSLLTLTTMSNGARQDLPQVSYIKALDIWLTFSQALIFLVLLEYSFVSYYMTKRTTDCSHRNMFYEERVQECKREEKARKSIVNNNKPVIANNTEGSDLNRNKKSQQFSLTHGISACLNESSALMSVTPVPSRLFTKFDTNKPCARCSEKNERIAFKIDEYSRWLFPTVFSLFCVSYWLYFTWRSSASEG
ncbi:Ligand-Gated ion Channel [Caenorhabditis elegans]|uniref:Ligand-Gated ion Channel n=1 Tax=Caenorhabditis elegans TaxID=6239 RepID=O17402_CAEEL|nr:Ligand-Gated ion Channel [Caenorhabditis elegans]CCD64425.1 Ligand-Gated ion Channel [Caenorhabditis elegans]|eukprot:NP_504821.3 Ligand-Gated ion Channel [Caenorhabditis elegans]